MNCACTSNVSVELTNHLETLNATLVAIQQCLAAIDARLTALEGCVGDWHDEESVDESEDEDEDAL